MLSSFGVVATTASPQLFGRSVWLETCTESAGACRLLYQVTTSGVPVRAGLYDLDAGFEGTTAAEIKLYHAPTTPEIAHDASAADVEDILETLPTLGQVGVRFWGTSSLPMVYAFVKFLESAGERDHYTIVNC